jgi:hypothetical protein
MMIIKSKRKKILKQKNIPKFYDRIACPIFETIDFRLVRKFKI